MLHMLMGHQFYFKSLPFDCHEETCYLDYMKPKNETIQRMVYSDSDETWLLAYHQLILFILVAGRAVMPNSKERINRKFSSQP